VKLQCKTTVLVFQQPLLQSSEIILICCLGAQRHFLLLSMLKSVFYSPEKVTIATAICLRLIIGYMLLLSFLIDLYIINICKLYSDLHILNLGCTKMILNIHLCHNNFLYMYTNACCMYIFSLILWNNAY